MTTLPEYVFAPDGPGRYLPTPLGRGPWDPGAMHGGAPAALMAAAFDELHADPALPIARLSYDFVRPIPLAPLTLTTSVVRSGRRVVQLAAELHAGETLVCTAGALRVAAAVPLRPDESAAADDPPLPGPDRGKARSFTLDDSPAIGFATAMEMRWLEGVLGPGPSTVWMRLAPALVDGVPTSPLARLVASADFGNGLAAPVPWGGFVFINADLTLHLHRPPLGEWIGMRSRTHVDEGGAALAESRLYDESGPVGRSLQSLVLARRDD